MKMVVYQLRTGTSEYRATPQEWERMREKHPNSFKFVRNEDAKEVKPGPVSVPSPKSFRVSPAPRAQAKMKARPETVKEVKRGPKAEEKPTNPEKGSE